MITIIPSALVPVACAFLPALSAFAPFTWFIGVGLGFGLYTVLMRRQVARPRLGNMLINVINPNSSVPMTEKIAIAARLRALAGTRIGARTSLSGPALDRRPP